MSLCSFAARGSADSNQTSLPSHRLGKGELTDVRRRSGETQVDI